MRKNAFTLVEVVIALGITTFAIVPIVALLPIGLGVFQDAKTVSVEREIIGQITSQLQNSPYSMLFDSDGTATANVSAFERHYDNEGRDITTNRAANKLAAIYTVTLNATNAVISGSSGIVTEAGINGLSASGATGVTTHASQSLAQTIKINVACHNKSNRFSVLIVNKGY